MSLSGVLAHVHFLLIRRAVFLLSALPSLSGLFTSLLDDDDDS